MPRQNSDTSRLAEVDALRGIAAMSVVLFHYTTRFTELFAPPYSPTISFQNGHYGVNLFFIISGFVIFMTLERTSKPMDFVISRFSRLFPAYWFAIFLTYSITQIDRPADAAGRQRPQRRRRRLEGIARQGHQGRLAIPARRDRPHVPARAIPAARAGADALVLLTSRAGADASARREKGSSFELPFLFDVFTPTGRCSRNAWSCPRADGRKSPPACLPRRSALRP